MPYLRAGMTALRIAAAAGRLAGFPVPDFVAAAKGMLDQQLALLDSLSGDAADFLSQHTGLDGHAAMAFLFEGIKAASDGNLCALQATVGATKPHPTMLQCMGRSAMEMRELLGVRHPNWEANTGLIKATCRHDGQTEWVLPEHKSAFEAQGGALLGTESTVQAGKVESQNAQLQSSSETIASLQQELELLRKPHASTSPAAPNQATVAAITSAPLPQQQPGAPPNFQMATSLAAIKSSLCP